MFCNTINFRNQFGEECNRFFERNNMKIKYKQSGKQKSVKQVVKVF